MPSVKHKRETTHAFVAFRRTVWRHYTHHGRHDLPWRKTRDPYRILVSEVMLQQTQVARVIPKYTAFLRAFPTVRALARAPLRDVLTRWQGLGYNRRAKALHDAAHHIVHAHGGRVPRTERELTALPGIGTYTARAVCAFAYDTPCVLIETNIRTVLIHELLGQRHGVPDTELMEFGERLLDSRRPREWHWALMDYGAHLKARGVRLNNASKHYTKQPTFKGSDREVRGAVVRYLTERPRASTRTLVTALRFPAPRVSRQLHALAREGLVRRRGTSWSL